MASPKQAAIHFALVALSRFAATHPETAPSAENLRKEVKAFVGSIELPEQELDEAIGELYVTALAFLLLDTH